MGKAPGNRRIWYFLYRSSLRSSWSSKRLSLFFWTYLTMMFRAFAGLIRWFVWNHSVFYPWILYRAHGDAFHYTVKLGSGLQRLYLYGIVHNVRLLLSSSGFNYVASRLVADSAGCMLLTYWYNFFTFCSEFET